MNWKKSRRGLLCRALWSGCQVACGLRPGGRSAIRFRVCCFGWNKPSILGFVFIKNIGHHIFGSHRFCWDLTKQNGSVCIDNDRNMGSKPFGHVWNCGMPPNSPGRIGQMLIRGRYFQSQGTLTCVQILWVGWLQICSSLDLVGKSTTRETMVFSFSMICEGWPAPEARPLFVWRIAFWQSKIFATNISYSYSHYECV